ncbi:hypothetical protein JUJ52_08860 [Virgibacillus sp. AGTR]|uniref:hypothetical protein n=1 Tax=unclassified Virgibacillus TaxID=2620237 RepID=UPI000EF49524|nr:MULTISPECIES: hypothetical protein [unclassified Virgibacillus]MCC2250076.1 hypothetical protein [Virgibacillus sp. AGTR]QRZ17771.1 hypothetical protein JUJ52_18815 [Virgibacillus sp. AGTR]
MYIDKTYYIDDFLGESVEDEETLDRYIKRASEVIDQVTNYKIQMKGFDSYIPFIQEQIKKSTAAQVEFYAEKGGVSAIDAGTESELTSVSIDSFSYQDGGASNSGNASKQSKRVSPSALEYLKITGLLYTGLDVR